MCRRRRHRRMPQPDHLIAPPRLLRHGFEGAAKQRPLQAELIALTILEIGGDVPPLDAKSIMRAVIRRKTEHPPRHHRCVRLSLIAHPGKALLLRRRLIATAEQQREHQHHAVNPHGQTSSTNPPVACGTANTAAMPKPIMSPATPTPSVAAVATGTPATAGASQTPAR